MQLFGSLFDATTGQQANAQSINNDKSLVLPTNLCNLGSDEYDFTEWDKCWFNDWALSARHPVNPGNIIENIVTEYPDNKLEAPKGLALYTAENFYHDEKYPMSAVGCRMVALERPDTE